MKINDLNNLLKKADSLLEELDQNAAGPELEAGKELKNEATEDKKPEEDNLEKDNKDVYCDACHKEAEDVKEVVVKEESQVAAGPELKEPKELKNEATTEGKPEEAAAEKDNKDVFPADEHKQAEEVEGVVIKEQFSDAELFEFLDEAGYEPTYENLAILKEGLANGTYVITEDELEQDPEAEDAKEEHGEESKDAERGEAKEEKAEEEKEEPKEEEKSPVEELKDAVEDKPEEELKENLSDLDLMNILEANGYEANLENLIALKEDIRNGKVSLVEEESQVAAGPELEAGKELKNEATTEGKPEESAGEKDNKDIYPADEHKQVEDVVGLVVEAASRCKKAGKPGTIANLCEEVSKLCEEEGAKLLDLNIAKSSSEKEYDEDASENSVEMNGNKKEFKDYKDIQGDKAEAALTAVVPAEAVHESVKYTSLKEAYLLDEGYFKKDTYIKETAEDKVAKLSEQVSLLMARDAKDPLYEELLNSALNAQRLQEAIINKYSEVAAPRVAYITESKN